MVQSNQKQMKQTTTMQPQVNIGDKLLRRNMSTEPTTWVEFTVNETYLKLIKEFPDDYRNLDNTPLKLLVTQTYEP